MNTPLATCLPDFGSGDAPKAIEDHSPPTTATFRSVPGAPKAKAAAAPKAKEGKLKSAGDTLKSVVRHIKLVDEPGFISPLVKPTPPVDVDALLKEHGDKVRAEEAEKARTALAAAITEERKAHEEQRRKERAEWVETEASRLAEQIVAALSDLEESLSQSMVRIFAPFLKDAVRDKALGELRDTVLSLLGETDEARIEVSGPGDLIGKIRDAIADSAPERGGQIVFTVCESTDIRVVAGDIVCATQLAVWNRRIENALGLQ
ncbi:hypothetical protein ACUSIJ_18465 [Pseudochelatococcus sp. B33]